MLVLGDAHADDEANRDALLATYEQVDPDTVLQVGDLGYYTVPAPTWFIAGNNEDFDIIDPLRRGERTNEVDPWVHLLASTAVDVAGLRVAGLSGTYAPTQYDRPRSALEGDGRRHFVNEDIARARQLDAVDILLVHEAPHGLLSFGYDPGCDHVDKLISELSPSLCLVGHYHHHRETRIEETHTVSLAPVWECYYSLDPETLALERHERSSPSK